MFRPRPGVIILMRIGLSLFTLRAIPRPLPDPGEVLMFGSERGCFPASGIHRGYGFAFRDLSGDGLPDLYIVCFMPLNRLPVNEDSGFSFSDRTIASRLGGDLMLRGIFNLEPGVAAVDADNDGDADPVVTGWTGTARGKCRLPFELFKKIPYIASDSIGGRSGIAFGLGFTGTNRRGIR